MLQEVPAQIAAVVTPDAAAVAYAPIESIIEEPVEEPVEEQNENRVLDKQAMQQVLDNRVSEREAEQVLSLLMLDIKMHASVSGDRLSLGSSEPLLGMVKENLFSHYPRENSLAYLGKGRFVFLIETDQVEQALNLSKTLMDHVPQLLVNLDDIELLSHAAFLRIPEHSVMSAGMLLKHCAAACKKTELAGRDNEAYVIGKELWQQADDVRAVAGVASRDVETQVLPASTSRNAELSY